MLLAEQLAVATAAWRCSVCTRHIKAVTTETEGDSGYLVARAAVVFLLGGGGGGLAGGWGQLGVSGC